MGLIEDLKRCSQGGKYVCVADVLSYHRPYNFLPGKRGGGKSTAVAIYCILDYKYNHHMWIYTRRTRDETEHTCKTFFDNACQIVKRTLGYNISVTYKSGAYTISIDGGQAEQCGFIVPLSLQYKYKSANFSKVYTIIFDEWLIDKAQGQKHLGSSAMPDIECNAMLSLYGTVDRGIGCPYRNETRVFFLGNASQMQADPFLLQYGIADELERNPNAKIIAPKNAPWVLQKARPVIPDSQILSSWQWKLSDETSRAYIFGDSGTDDTRFVISDPGYQRHTLDNCIIQGKSYIIEASQGMEKMHVRAGRDPYARTISVDLMGHDGKIDMEMARAWRAVPVLVVLSNAFDRGLCSFDSMRTKSAFLRYLRYI